MERLITIQQGLRVVKDKSGDQGRFKFRSAEDIFEKVKPLLEKTKTAVVVSDEIVEIGGRLSLKATATLFGCSEQKDCSVTIASAVGFALFDKHEIVSKKTGELVSTMSNEQCTGSASSYARKYALCGLFAIDNDENDPDQPEVKKATETKPTVQKPAATPSEKPANKPEEGKEVELSAEEEDDFLAICSDIDAAADFSSLAALVDSAKGTKYESMVRSKANLVAKRNGWKKQPATA